MLNFFICIYFSYLRYFFFHNITSILRGLPCTCLPSWSWQKWLQSWSKQELLPSLWGWKEILASACFFQVSQLAHQHCTYKLGQKDSKNILGFFVVILAKAMDAPSPHVLWTLTQNSLPHHLDILSKGPCLCINDQDHCWLWLLTFILISNKQNMGFTKQNKIFK